MRRQTDAYVDDDDIVPDGGSVRRPMLLMDGRRFAVAFDAENHQPHYGRPTGAVHDARIVRTAARAAYLRRLTDAWRAPGRDANPGGGFTCPECHGTGIDPDDDSNTDRCDRCGGTGYIEAPNNSSSAQRNDPGHYPDPRLRTDAAVRDARAAATASYHAMCARLRDAWRTPIRDAAQPDNSSSNAEWRRHVRNIPDPGDPNENLVRRRLEMKTGGALRHGATGDPNAELVRSHLTTESTAAAQAERDRVWEDYRQRLSTAWQTRQTNPRAASAIERQGEQWRGGR
jgi:hypothetical protein